LYSYLCSNNKIEKKNILKNTIIRQKYIKNTNSNKKMSLFDVFKLNILENNEFNDILENNEFNDILENNEFNDTLYKYFLTPLDQTILINNKIL